MATLTAKHSLINLRRDAGSQMRDGADLRAYFTNIKDIATKAMRRIPELRNVDATDQLKVTICISDEVEDGAGQADSPVGRIDFIIEVQVDAEIAYQYYNDGSVGKRFADALGSALGEAAQELPNQGQDFFAAIGLTDPSTQILSKRSMDIEAASTRGRPDSVSA